MMKLRQLVANSLPVGRNRKKKDKDKHQGASSSKSTTPSGAFNGNYSASFFPKRHRTPVPAAPPKVPEPHSKELKNQKASFTDEELELVAEMRNIKTSDRTPSSLAPLSPFSDNTMDFTLNFNLNTSDPKFPCYKHIQSTFSPDSNSHRQSYDDQLSTFVPKGRSFQSNRHSFSPEPTYKTHAKAPERPALTPEELQTSRSTPRSTSQSTSRSYSSCCISANRNSLDSYYSSQEKPELHYSVSPALDSQSDVNSYSLTRPRTRIKTNPWLPSPRGSSTSSSPAYSPTDMYSPTAGKSFPQEAIYEEIPAFKDSPVHYNIQPNHTSGSMSDGPTDDSLMRSHVSESDNSLMSWSTDCPPSYEHSLLITSTEDNTTIRSYSDDYKDRKKDIDNNDIKDVSDTKSITSKVSFHYEEAFESKMEDDCDMLSSNESLSDGYGSDDEDEVFFVSGAGSLDTSLSDGNSCDSASLSKVSAIVSDCGEDMSEGNLHIWQDSSADTDDTICEYEGEYDLQSSTITELTPPRSRRLWRSPKLSLDSSDGPVSSTSKTMEDESNNVTADSQFEERGPHENPGNSTAKTLYKLSDVSSLDSGADSGLYSMDSVSLDRSIGEVRSSLQDKVTKLRQDKLLVDEKIRQAQEEDRIRMQEKMRFQKQLTQHRKQMLLNTLQDLKTKLENQSQRLQSTYSSVLHMQKHMIRQRKHMSAHEISAADAQEAPF